MENVLGIDIGGTKIRAGLVAEDGRLLKLSELPTEAERGAQHVLAQVVRLTERFSDANIAGIGIGTAGQVDLNGQIISATRNIPGWTGVQLQSEIAQKPVFPSKL